MKEQWIFEDSGIPLNDNEQVLFLPSPNFIKKIFLGATKPASYVALAKAYVFHAWENEQTMDKLWDVVHEGFIMYDGGCKDLRPFAMLF